MGVLLAFAVGYAIGARAGSQDFDDVVDAVKAIGRSQEFHDLLTSLRSHAAHTLRELATQLDGGDADGAGARSVSTADLVDRVKSLAGRG
jgi:hypothetical protein